LFSPIKSLKSDHPHALFWFAASLVTPLYFGLISLHYALTQNYVIQDDARQHVVWLQQFVDPQLFPNDLIAQYFQAVAPVGYKFVYWTMAKIGIEPLVLAKILPLILGLITTAYIFKVALRILPIPASAFLATLLLNHTLWLKDDLISATPRAFLYPLFAAFLYYLLNRSLLPCLISIALQGLFFPQMVLVEIAILTVRLLRWQGRSLKLTQVREHYLFWLSGLAIALIVILPFALGVSEVGTLVTAAQMQTMPEFGLKGRSQYFGVEPLLFMVNGGSGIRIPIIPPILWSSFALPFLLKSRRLPIIQSVTEEVEILLQIIVGSLGIFFLAHILLFKLYFPSRYTYHSFRFVMAIGAGIVLFALLESGWRWLQQKRQAKSRFSVRESLLIGLIGLFATFTLVAPAVPWVFLQFASWKTGDAPRIYRFLAAQPKDTLVASIATEASNIPAFAQRSILVGEEFMFAYHPNYYNPLQTRAVDVVRAQFSSDLTETKEVIQKYGIDFFLIERSSFDPNYLLSKNWLMHSSFSSVVSEAVTQLQQGKTPALVKLVDRCSAVSIGNLVLLDAVCITATQSESL
jgi:hypothetical protein